MADRVVLGDFHVIKMDGVYHVVFRPDDDPEWFRIVATFYTYARAWIYCDIERATVWEPDTETAEEETKGLRTPPLAEHLPASALEVRDGVCELVRNVYDGGEHVEPHPYAPPVDAPDNAELPRDYERRIFEEAAGAISKAADEFFEPITTTIPEPDGEPLTDQQSAVYATLASVANPAGLTSLSLTKIANRSKVPLGSITFLIESLEKKRMLSVVERGRAGQTSIYKITQAEGRA